MRFRFVALTVAALVLATVLSACSSSGQSDGPASQDAESSCEYDGGTLEYGSDLTCAQAEQIVAFLPPSKVPVGSQEEHDFTVQNVSVADTAWAASRIDDVEIAYSPKGSFLAATAIVWNRLSD